MLRKEIGSSWQARVLSEYLGLLGPQAWQEETRLGLPESLEHLEEVTIEATVEILSTPRAYYHEQQVGIVRIIAGQGGEEQILWEMPLCAEDDEQVIVLLNRELTARLRSLYRHNLGCVTSFMARHPQATATEEVEPFVIHLVQARHSGASHELTLGMFDPSAEWRIQELQADIAADPDSRQEELQRLLDEGPSREVPEGAISRSESTDAAADDRSLSAT